MARPVFRELTLRENAGVVVDNLLPSSDTSSKSRGGPAPAGLPYLLPQHLADLRQSGLTDAYIAASECFRTATDQAKIARCLRWKRPPKGVGFGPCLTISFLGRDGKPIGYYRFKPDIPLTRNEKIAKYESPISKGDPAFGNRAFFPLHTRALLSDAATPLVITEGEKKACKADQEGFPCIGLTGVWNWTVKKKDEDAERELIPDLATVAWKDRAVYVCFDSDITEKKSVAIAEWHLCQVLAAKGATVKVVRLPGGPDGAKCGLDDFLVGHNADDFRALLAAAQAPTKPEDDRPEVLLMALEYVAVDQAIGALAKGARDVFQRGGQLVRIAFPKRAEQSRRLTASGGPKIEPIPAPALRTRLTNVAKIVQFVEAKKGEPPQKMAAHPPQWLVPAVESAGIWPGIRPLEAVVTYPVLLADGSVLQREGYHADSGLMYLPTAEYPPIPEAPTLADAHAAVETLKDVVCDFPFSKDVHKAAWFAALLTPLGRFAFHGPAPLFLIDANVPGSGKSILTDLISLIITGGDFARFAYTSDNDEMRKAILAIALQGERLVLLDNLVGCLGSPSLDEALTATVWQGRVLGKTHAPQMPLMATWYGSGNNIAVVGDTTRRVCYIRLDSPEEKPEERTGFRHPDLLAWVRENRGRLLTAAITILSAYIRAGKPKPTKPLKAWGSYETWTDLIRGAIVWAGLFDPGDTREMLAERSGRESDALRGLIAGWKQLGAETKESGKTCAQVLQLLKDETDFNREEKTNQNKYGELREVLADLFDLPIGKLPTAQRLGKTLRKFAGRNVGGFCIDHHLGTGKVQEWSVRCLEAKPTADSDTKGSEGSGRQSNCEERPAEGHPSQGSGGSEGSAAPIFTRIENSPLRACNRWGITPLTPSTPLNASANGYANGHTPHTAPDAHLPSGPEVEEGYL
jgi:hypothetical protein